MTETGESAPRQAAELARAESAGLNQAMRILSYLIAGIGLYGLLGWLGDKLFKTSFLLPVGIILGAVLAVYMIFRYVATESAKAGSPLSDASTKEGAR